MRELALSALARKLAEQPASQIEELQRAACEAIAQAHHAAGLDGAPPTISVSYVRRVFWAWGYSWHKRVPVQINKFTPLNMTRYVDYYLWVMQQPLERLKFLDECHIVPRGPSFVLDLVLLFPVPLGKSNYFKLIYVQYF